MVERHKAEDSSFLADGLGGNIPPEVFPSGRTCLAPDCDVQLSRYNSTEWCSLHESPANGFRPYETSTRQKKGGRRRRRSGSRRATAKTADQSAA